MSEDETEKLRAYQVILKTEGLIEQYGVAANNSQDALALLIESLGPHLTVNENLSEGSGPIPDQVADDAGIDRTKRGDYRKLEPSLFTRDIEPEL